MRLPPVCATEWSMEITVWDWKQNILPEKKGGLLLDSLYELSKTEDEVQVAGEKKRSPGSFWRIFSRDDVKISGRYGCSKAYQMSGCDSSGPEPDTGGEFSEGLCLLGFPEEKIYAAGL